ncbi:MAG TPA: NAD(+)/NADH kinase [Dehalococcoidia bacterium]|nr:NAD(+)/NADH kinase [Dehalococcoidia bacterium]
MELGFGFTKIVSLTLHSGDGRLLLPVKRVGILYHPKLEKARAFSCELDKILRTQGISLWLCSAWDEGKAKPQVAGSDLILSIGGDGTMLRAARAVVPHAVPIVGINFGSLGFMTELEAAEALDKLPQLLGGEGWIEERAMLEAELVSQGKNYHALNDVVVGRGSSARLIQVETRIGGEVLTTYRTDGVIVATATGSTSYSLAAGGPILYPQAREIILEPVCSHLTLDKALVLPPEAVIQLKVATSHQAMLSIDGQVELPLRSGDKVEVKLGPYVARFLRVQPKTYFYSSLESRLKGKIS